MTNEYKDIDYIIPLCFTETTSLPMLSKLFMKYYKTNPIKICDIIEHSNLKETVPLSVLLKYISEAIIHLEKKQNINAEYIYNLICINKTFYIGMTNLNSMSIFHHIKHGIIYIKKITPAITPILSLQHYITFNENDYEGVRSKIKPNTNVKVNDGSILILRHIDAQYLIETKTEEFNFFNPVSWEMP